MIHLNDISLAQATLIEIGAAFQLIAIWWHLKDTAAYRRQMHSREEREHVQEQGLESGNDDQAGRGHAGTRPDQSFKEDSHTPMDAGNPTRTSKGKFVQKFDFRHHGS
jgi:hypothetical protein